MQSTIKGVHNWITCLDQRSILENQVNFVTKVGYTFWTYLTLSLDSKIGPVTYILSILQLCNFTTKITHHTCEEGGVHLRNSFGIYRWTWKTNIYLKKTVKVGP